MVRGIFFKIQQNSNVLYKILKCIDTEKYCWHNIDSQNEVWDSPQGNVFFEKDYYNGKDFSKLINSNHFIVFLKLQAYFENGKFFDIQTFDDFWGSDCQLLLLIYDCESVVIYAKDEKVIEAIYDNALANKYIDVCYITESNDKRTSMNVM